MRCGNVDAVQAIRIRLERIEPRLARHRRQVVLLGEHGHDAVVIRAVRVGKAVDRPHPAPLEEQFREPQLVALLRRRERREWDVVRRVTADLHTAVLEIKEVVPRHVAGLSDVVRHDVEHRLHPALLQHWEHDAPVVLIAVVKGEDHGLCGQFLLALARACIVLRGDGRIALLREVVQLCRKLCGWDGVAHLIRFCVILHHVIFQYGKARRLCRQQPCSSRQNNEQRQRQSMGEPPRNTSHQSCSSSDALRIFRRR